MFHAHFGEIAANHISGMRNDPPITGPRQFCRTTRFAFGTLKLATYMHRCRVGSASLHYHDLALAGGTRSCNSLSETQSRKNQFSLSSSTANSSECYCWLSSESDDIEINPYEHARDLRPLNGLISQECNCMRLSPKATTD